jgi:hypothetical protein
MTGNLFGPLKQDSGRYSFHSNEELQIAVHEWLQKQEPDICCKGIFKLVPMWTDA